jgi:hypothetical protein
MRNPMRAPHMHCMARLHGANCATLTGFKRVARPWNALALSTHEIILALWAVFVPMDHHAHAPRIQQSSPGHPPTPAPCHPRRMTGGNGSSAKPCAVCQYECDSAASTALELQSVRMHVPRNGRLLRSALPLMFMWFRLISIIFSFCDEMCLTAWQSLHVTAPCTVHHTI